MGRTIALTGATGFLGWHLCRALRETTHRVVAVVRNPERARTALLDTGWVDEVRSADLNDAHALRDAFRGVDVVIGNAALGSWLGSADDYVRTNVEGCRNTVRAAAEAGVHRVVHVSTVAVYRPRLRTFVDEAAPRRDRDPPRFDPTRLSTDIRYSRTKTLAEDAALEEAARAGLTLLLPRPGPIYGSRDTRFTQRLVASLRRRVQIVPTVGVPLVHAGDVARAIAACCDRDLPHGRAFNLAGPPVSLYEVHRTLRRVASVSERVLPLPVPAWAGFDCARAAEELDFVCRPLEDGLREVWERRGDA